MQMMGVEEGCCHCSVGFLRVGQRHLEIGVLEIQGATRQMLWSILVLGFHWGRPG
jgi:hypothetical protein